MKDRLPRHIQVRLPRRVGFVRRTMVDASDLLSVSEAKAYLTKIRKTHPQFHHRRSGTVVGSYQ